ncbi:MAG: hypothetical protein IC227_01460 [Enterococcus lacertideformus]|uniref:Uncharacterized protein n=1 Tax=Enterococcus lacertideformus TaxID=2771493 RepID=A0A931FBZ6_9ENTE|nr:hypothetical protein [Enterococcus lacertideformus]
MKVFQSNNKGEVARHLFLLLTYLKVKVILYHDPHCLSEGKVSHNQEGFRQLLEEITALPETPEIVLNTFFIESKVLLLDKV